MTINRFDVMSPVLKTEQVFCTYPNMDFSAYDINRSYMLFPCLFFQISLTSLTFVEYESSKLKNGQSLK